MISGIQVNKAVAGFSDVVSYGMIAA